MHLEGRSKLFVALLAALWSSFQLAVASVWLLDSVVVRAVHLAFALTLLFLTKPRGKRKQASQLHWKTCLYALFAAVVVLYLVLDYEGLGTRHGMLLPRDIVMGSLLLLLLLEGAQRALGPALPLIALLFLLSSLFASSLPSFLASKSVSLPHLVNKIALTTEGIYGIPLRVSADTVFLFVLFGALLEKAGGGHYFVQLANRLLGRFRGGPAKAAVLASGLTGMISGSSIANTVTTGTFTIPLMKKSGYPAAKAGAIEVAASTNGQLMPPIMGAAAFIIAEYCHLDYLSLIKHAFVPALLSYLTLFYLTHLEAVKLRLQPMKGDVEGSFFLFLREGLHHFLPLSVLIYELVIVRHSANLAAFHAILALMGVTLLHSLLTRKGAQYAFRLIACGLTRGALNMVAIALAVATAGIIVGTVSMGLGSKITQIIALLSGGSLIGLLLVTALVSLLLGMGLPTTANYIIMASLTVPAMLTLAEASGVVIPLVAAHLFCFYFGILADDTPPVGLAAYAASAIAQSKPLQTGLQGFIYDLRTAILPFMFVFNSQLLLIGVESILQAVWIVISGLVALMAFASLTQRFLLTHTTGVEMFLLALSTLLILRADFFAQQAPLLTHNLWILCGVALACTVWLKQKARTERAAPRRP